MLQKTIITSDGTHYHEIIIGFEARERFLSLEGRFKKFEQYDVSNYVNHFLLKRDIDMPLSVDVNIWDSILSILQLEPTTWIGPRPPKWQDLAELTDYLAQQPIDQSYDLIAITRFYADEQTRPARSVKFGGSALRLMPYLVQLKQIDAGTYNAPNLWDHAVPKTLDPAWSFIGYDIGDEWALSGLMNCGYTEDEIDDLSAAWGPKLNEFHLFTDLNDAMAFCDLSDQRVREHSPFSVYGWYRIRHVTPT